MNIVKCKYAGDPNDSGCKICNGCWLEEDGEKIEATECQGYEPEEVAQAPVAQPTPQPVEKTPETPREAPTTTQWGDNTSTATTTLIRAESGVSVEHQGRWYKLSYTEERIVPASANVEVERAKLWDAVNSEVDKQVADILDQQ